MSAAAPPPPPLDPKPVLVATAPVDAGGFILPNDEKVPVPGTPATEAAGFPNAGATVGAPATVVVDVGTADLPKIPPTADVDVVEPKPPKLPKLDATSVTGASAASFSLSSTNGGANFGVSGGAENRADVSPSSFLFAGAAVASDPKLNTVFSELALAAARCNGGGED